jgi:hypothetical protein
MAVGAGRGLRINRVPAGASVGPVLRCQLAGLLMYSAVHSEQREDLLAAYQYIASSGLQNALAEKGHAEKIDASRIIITGGSAGGTSTIAMVRTQLGSQLMTGTGGLHAERQTTPASSYHTRIPPG